MKRLRPGRGTEMTRCKSSLFSSKNIGTDLKSENRPTRVEDINTVSTTKWTKCLTNRETLRNAFALATLAFVFTFICMFLKEDDMLYWGRFLLKLESILDTCSKISQRLPSARRIWRSMREGRPIHQINGLLKKIKNGDSSSNV